MLIKPSQFNIPFPTLYSRSIIWQVMELIIVRPCVFPYNDDNIVFTRIFHMIYIPCFKIDHGVLTLLQLGLIHVSFCFQWYVFILVSLDPVASFLQIIIKQCKCCIFFFDGLLMLSLDHFNFCIKPTWYDIFQDVLLERFTLIFSRVYNDIKSTSKRDENILILSVFLRGSILRIPLSACKKTRVF